MKQNQAKAAKILKETCIVESLNLKAAIHYLTGDITSA